MRDKGEIIKIANRRIANMFRLSNASRDNNGELSSRYLNIMEKIALRADITLPQSIKRLYCKNCKMLYSRNFRVRISGKILKITCLNCGNIRRINID
ncbi:MAG: ribonuclease P protein component 4 [Thermoplasmataceae archaeon]